MSELPTETPVVKRGVGRPILERRNELTITTIREEAWHLQAWELFHAGVSYPIIAGQVGMSVSTVKEYLRGALAECSRKIEGYTEKMRAQTIGELEIMAERCWAKGYGLKGDGKYEDGDDIPWKLQQEAQKEFRATKKLLAQVGGFFEDKREERDQNLPTADETLVRRIKAEIFTKLCTACFRHEMRGFREIWDRAFREPQPLIVTVPQAAANGPAGPDARGDIREDAVREESAPVQQGGVESGGPGPVQG